MRLVLVLISVALITGCLSSNSVTVLTPEDYHAITNVIRSDTSERILDVRLVRGGVIVDTGRERVVDHCYELEKTRKGWKIVWKGT